MAFRPKQKTNSGGKVDRPYDPKNFPVPRKGLRKGRISLIVDLGEQAREPIWVDNKGEAVTEDTPGAVLKEQKDCQQVAVHVDLTHDIVEYGNDIGKAPYRLLVNKVYNNEVKGINFTFTAQKDPKGNILKGPDGKWLPMILPPASVLSKLAKVVNKPEVCLSGEIDQLLGEPLMVQVDVKETPHKEGKKDINGDVIVYKNVHYKGCAEVPEDDDGNPQEVNELAMEPKCITFENATKDDIKFIRYNLRKIIKLAKDYPGSAMERAIQAYEAENASNDKTGEADQQQEEEKEQAPKKPAAKKAVKKFEPVVEYDDDSDGAPF